MKTVFLIAFILGAILLQAHVNRGEIPLYAYHQTWQGGELTVLVSYDWRLGVQKRILQ